MSDSFRKRNDDIVEDHPTYSRLFVVCDKKTKEGDLSPIFSEYGTVEDIRMPYDRNSGESKGIAFVKFSKTSAAAIALENLNGKSVPACNKPLKVMVAANRSDIQTDDNSKDKYTRLFINIYNNETENSLQEHFGQFGSVESVVMQRDRHTGELRGGAYIKYYMFSHAALAFEQCDRKYRAIFAQPRASNQRRQETAFESNVHNLAASANIKTSLLSMMKPNPSGYTHVNYMCSPYLSQYQLEQLFDIVPGMVRCQFFLDLIRNCAKGTVAYSNPMSAAYAVEKLNNLEYPPGCKIFVKPNDNFSKQEQYSCNISNAVNNLKGAIAASTNNSSPDLAQLAEAIAEASKIIQQATGGISEGTSTDTGELNYCSAKLPPKQPLADIDSVVAKRCFLVCKPQPPSVTVLRDVFCRFGDLINVYTLPNKTVGYARYASVSAADEAIKTLHGAEICGVRIKVLEAEDEAPAKRLRHNNYQP